MVKKTIKPKTTHPILRTVILAVCIVVVFIFVVNILLNIFTRHNEYHKVPDFTGLTQNEASFAAYESKLKIELSDSLYVPAYAGGIILEQRPLPGSKVKSGRRVFLTINSYKQRTVKVPYVAGFSLRQAKNNLELSGLTIKELIYSEDIATNNVLEQYYEENQITKETNLEIEHGSAITLIVGKASNAALVSVPKLIGINLREAQSRLWELGLNIAIDKFDADVNRLNRYEAKVYNQSIIYEQEVALGEQIKLSLTFDEQQIQKGRELADSTYKVLQQREQDILQRELDSLEFSSFDAEDSIFQQMINF